MAVKKPRPPAPMPEFCLRPDPADPKAMQWWHLGEQRPFDPNRDPWSEIPTKTRPRPKVPDQRFVRVVPYQFQYGLVALDGEPPDNFGDLRHFLTQIPVEARAAFKMLTQNCVNWAVHVKRVARGLEPSGTPQVVPGFIGHWGYDRANSGPLDATGKPMIPPCYQLIGPDRAPIDWAKASAVEIAMAEPVGLPADSYEVIALMDPGLRAKAAKVVPDWAILSHVPDNANRLAVTRGARAVSIRRLLFEFGAA